MSTKPAIKSKSIAGSAVALVGAIYPLLEALGIDIGFSEVQLIEIVSSAMVVGGAILAWYGRVTATSKIKGLVKSE